MSRFFHGVAVALAVAFAASPGDALAQNAAADAAFAETLRQATAALDRGDFAEAIDLCERASRVRSTASVRYCLAWSHHRRDEPVEAYVEARNCQRELPNELDPRRRQWIQGRCDEVVRSRQPQVARVRVAIEGESPPGLRVSVNGRVQPAEVLGLELPVRAGSVAVRAEAEGFEPAEEAVEVAGDQGRVVTLRLRRVPVPDTVVTPPPPPVVLRRRVWEAVLGGALVAGGATLAGLGVLNLGVHGAEDPAVNGLIAQRCAFGAPTQTTAQGTTCDGVGVVTPVMLGAGVAALGVGVFLLVDGLRARPVAVGRARPTTVLGRGGGVVGVEVVF